MRLVSSISALQATAAAGSMWRQVAAAQIATPAIGSRWFATPTTADKLGTDKIGAKAEEAATGSGASGAADAAARTAGFDVPDVGTESADAPSPATAAAFGPGPDLMGGIDDVVGGSANMDGRRVAEGAQEMYREAKSGDRAGRDADHLSDERSQKGSTPSGPRDSK